MTAERATPLDPWVGCVVGTETGVVEVLTDGGLVRATYGGGMLALLARDRTCRPVPGSWVVLRRWPEERVTVEAPMRTPPACRVLPFRVPPRRTAP